MMIISDSVKKMPKNFFSFDKCIINVERLSVLSKKTLYHNWGNARQFEQGA